jgi:uncharacterized protein with PIN domain
LAFVKGTSFTTAWNATETGTGAETEIESLLEEKTVKYFNRFARCTSCGRIYWEGSHHGKMIKRIQEICMEDR